jgi:hypothetical protein
MNKHALIGVRTSEKCAASWGVTRMRIQRSSVQSELFHMDIGGKPLAYTPFCDNNKDMDGYRFWKGGFWEKHLDGKPYHISALYLVDVERLRQMAAGDIFRVIYDRLSKDPGSLSNLDQDLPNYAQHQVPIYSLPQEWLWCESWCGNATKEQAKTIDLCNNPGAMLQLCSLSCSASSKAGAVCTHRVEHAFVSSHSLACQHESTPCGVGCSDEGTKATSCQENCGRVERV